MAWIETIDESQADGELKDAYEAVIQSRGKLSNIMRVHSMRPDAMRAHMDLYRLRTTGFSDRDILDVNLITSDFNLVNRIAQGLGVECTEEEASGYRY